MLYQEMSYTCDIMYLFLQLGPGRPTGGFDHAALFPRSRLEGRARDSSTRLALMSTLMCWEAPAKTLEIKTCKTHLSPVTWWCFAFFRVFDTLDRCETSRLTLLEQSVETRRDILTPKMVINITWSIPLYVVSSSNNTVYFCAAAWLARHKAA